MDNERKIQDFSEIKIEPFTLIHDILKNWWVIMIGTISIALITYVVANIRYVPNYSTTATFVVASKGNATAISNLSAANTMAKTFENIIQSNMMKKIISENLGIDYIGEERISTEVLEDTNMLVLKVSAASPKEAIDIIRVIMEHYTEISYYSIGKEVMEVLQEPEVPVVPDNPLDVRESVKKVSIAGGVFLIFLFGFLSYMSDTIKREEEIEEKLDARSLGGISHECKYKTWKDFYEHKKSALLVNDVISGFAFVESYKKLATKVEYQLGKENRKVLVVTSVSENEGKSTVAANLAITLAEQGKNVLLMDGDLRRPSQFLIFGVQPTLDEEFGEYLKGEVNAKTLIHMSKVPNLRLVLGRNCYSSSTELLRSERLEKVLQAARTAMDYVIIDSPPAGLMGDAEVLADYSDAVMVVTRQNYMLAEDINDVLDSFREHHSKVLGVVLNGVRSLRTMPGYGYYGKYGKYGNYNRYENLRGKINHE